MTIMKNINLFKY